MVSLDAQAAAALRKPFPPAAVGKLPKPYKKESPKGNCNECGGYHGLPAVHLDYVGHAATTDRLLSVDPEWTWEPMGVDGQGLPALDRDGNLWGRMTVLGVTRIGVGDGLNAKERVSDFLRNAAMRFGVALDLWSKDGLESEVESDPQPVVESAIPPAVTPKARAWAATTSAGSTANERRTALTDWLDRRGKTLQTATDQDWNDFADGLEP